MARNTVRNVQAIVKSQSAIDLWITEYCTYSKMSCFVAFNYSYYIFLQSTPLAFVFIIKLVIIILIRIKLACFGFFSLERKDVQNFHFFKQFTDNSLILYIDGWDQQDSM